MEPVVILMSLGNKAQPEKPAGAEELTQIGVQEGPILAIKWAFSDLGRFVVNPYCPAIQFAVVFRKRS